MIKEYTKFALLPLALLLCTYVSTYGFPVAPECDLQINPDRYIVEFQMPNYIIETDADDGIGEGEEDDCGPYDMIVVDANWDGLDISGYPQLPFMSLHLILPDDAESVNVTFLPNETTFEYPSYPIIPAKKGNVYDIETDLLVSMDEECENSEYYIYGATSEYPDGFFRNFYTISDIYTVHGSKGVTLSIFPFAYYPHWKEIEVLLSGTFEIEFDGGDVHRKIRAQRDDNTVLTMATQLFFDSFNDEYLPDDPPHRGDYVIVAAHNYMEDALQPYVDYKLCQGYDIEVVYLDEWGCIGDRRRIKDMICSTSFGNPDFVLLIGSTDDIPPYSGSSDKDNPYSDDGYHKYLGRWVVPNNEEDAIPLLRNIINKTITAEQEYANTTNVAALFSGKDAEDKYSRQFYNDIENIADNYLSQTYRTRIVGDGRAMSLPRETMRSILENGVHLFVYSGHGSPSSIGSPYNYSDINSIRTSSFPMGFGFACRLNSYEHNNSFGMKWVYSEYGGVTFYGSTIQTYMSPDSKFSDKLFKCYKRLCSKKSNFPISVWLRIAETSYFMGFPGLVRGRQIAKYNLIGDPTLYVHGLDCGCYDDVQSQVQREIPRRVKSVSAKVQRSDVFDSLGHIVYSCDGDIGKAELEPLVLSGRVLLIKRTNSDATIEWQKIIR